MRVIIYTLMTIYLTGCVGKGAPVRRSDAGNQAADSAVHRVYSDMARPPMTVQVDRNVVFDRSMGR